MKIKALRKKDSKEFVFFHVNETLQMNLGVYVGELPNPMATTATIEEVKEYYSKFKPEIDFSNIELVEFDLIESDVIGADIRNKLTPMKNLPALLRVLKRRMDKDKRKNLKEIIEKEMVKCEENVEYIANLL